MKVSKFWGRALVALTLGCGVGFAPLAMAQTASGTMAPMSSMAPTAKPGAKFPRSDAFKTLAEATAHCPGDTVVWSSLGKSKSFHVAGSKYFGKTKHGAYVCEKDATSFGFHAAKN